MVATRFNGCCRGIWCDGTWREFTAFSEDILPRIERLDKEVENLGKTIKSEMHSVQEAQELVDSDQEMITEMQQEIAVAQRKLQELVNMESRLEMKMYKSEFKANMNR